MQKIEPFYKSPVQYIEPFTGAQCTTSIEPCSVKLKKWNAIDYCSFFVSDQAWVTLDRIQFVGACNPPTDPGRKPLAHRFLRHVPVRYLNQL